MHSLAARRLLNQQIAATRRRQPGDLAGSVYLLPGFDEYLIGYQDRSAVLAPDYAPLTHPGGSGVLFPTVVVDGQVVGVWKRTVKKKAVDLTVSAFVPLTQAQKDGIAAAAERYAGFLGQPLQLVCEAAT